MNNNDMAATFQFVTDKNNMFSFSQTEGVIKPHSFARIIVTWQPPTIGNFYERIFCLVRNHKVLYVDMMGTCFDILTKPLPIKQQHINSHRSRVIMGSHKQARHEELDFDRSMPMGSSKVGFRGEMTATLVSDGLGVEIAMDEPSQVVLHKEMLNSSAMETRDVKFSLD